MSRLLLIVLFWMFSAPAPAETAPASERTRVLFIGNSLVYVNNLPGLLRALAASQAHGPRIETATYVAPGGSVAERWKDGHAADALRNGRWDVLVLQERGGLLACVVDAERRHESECRNSQRAHQQFADLARARGTRVLLLATWGPDASWQQKLDRGLHAIARRSDATIVPAGSMLRAYAAANPAVPLFDSGFHTNLQGSLLLAAQLYAAISGRDAAAADLAIDFPLLPPNASIRPGSPLEAQQQVAGDGKTILIKAAALAPLLEAARHR